MKSKNKLFALIILLILGLISLRIAAYLSLPYSTLFWNTYTNREYNFSLKYPPQWKVIKQSIDENDAEIDFCYTDNACPASAIMGIHIHKNGLDSEQQQKLLDEMLKNKGDDQNNISDVIQHNINGEHLYSYQLESKGNVLPAGGSSFVAQGTLRGDFYSFDLREPNFFNPILSTFKFTH